MSNSFLIYIIIIALGVVAGSIKFRYLPVYLRFLTVLLAGTLVSELISRQLIHTTNNSNPVYHVYSLLEICIVCLLLRSITKRERTKRLCITVFLMVFIFSVINSLFIQGFMMFNSNADIVKSPVAVFFSFFILIEKLHDPVKTRFLIESDLLILIAILWFNITSFFFFMAHNYLVSNHVSTIGLGRIHYISNLVYYGLLLLSILIYDRKVYVTDQ